MEGGGGSILSGGEDKDRLLEERKNLRRQLRKAETSLWRSKEEDCKKGRKKLGSKLITSKEDYLRALVEKGIRRELRRSDRIREYWTRQQEKDNELKEEKTAAESKSCEDDNHDIVREEGEAEESKTEFKEEPSDQDDQLIQPNVPVDADPITICEDLLLIQEDLLAHKDSLLEAGSPKQVNKDLTDLEEFLVAEELLLQDDPLVPETLSKESVEKQRSPQSGKRVGLQGAGAKTELKEEEFEGRIGSLEAVHLLEPPSSPLLPVLVQPSQTEGGGEVVLLQDLNDPSGEQELPAAGEETSERGVQVRGRRCLKRTQELLYSCITCLVACLGPV